MRIKDLDPLIESLLDEISRRDFLKGLGASAALAASGQAKAGFFSSPKLFEPGIYEGRARHLLGGYSDDDSGEGWGENGKSVDIDIIITKDKIAISHHGTIKATQKLFIPTKSSTMEFDQIKISNDTLTAIKIDGRVKYTLSLNKEGKFKARRISKSRPDHEKGYGYHTWGYNGSVKPKGDDLK
jgi:hypothetical protein